MLSCRRSVRLQDNYDKGLVKGQRFGYAIDLVWCDLKLPALPRPRSPLGSPRHAPLPIAELAAASAASRVSP